jgi:flagellar basal-body rod modification protein FlgD
MISANDFLTLLVTEMQNQDPTADTDPNEYINQLVNVNSLEQLININQTLTTDLPSPSTSSASSASTQSAAAASNPAERHWRIRASQRAQGRRAGNGPDRLIQRRRSRRSFSAIFRAQARSRQSQRPQRAARGPNRGPRTGRTNPLETKGIGIAEILPSRLPAGRIGPPT